MMRRALLATTAAITVPAGWLAASSAILCAGLGKMDLYRFPFDQWLQAAPWFHRSGWWVETWIIVSAAIPTAVPALCGCGLARHWWKSRGRRLIPPPGGGLRPVAAAVTDNHGHAEWMSMHEARRLFPGPDPIHGGVVVGEACRVDQSPVANLRFNPRDPSTWGPGGKAPLLIDPCTEGSGHSVIFAGTGSYKTVSAVCSILHWTGSSVILDPSTELGPMLDGALHAQGKRVVHIGVPSNDEERPPATGFNVLAWIDITSPEAEIHVKTVIGWIYSEGAQSQQPGKREDPFFAPMGRQLLMALMAHMLWSDIPAEDKTLATFVDGMSVPEDDMMHLLAGIRAASNSPMARRIAGSLMKCRAEETFSGVFLNAVHGVSFLFTHAYAAMLSRGDFDPRALLSGDTTVFLNISLRTLESTPEIARVLVGALLNTVYQADGKAKARALFLLDEAARLGRLKALETARDTGRKYGVSLHLLLQSIGQMAEIWGRDGTRAWIDAASWIGYAAIRAGGAGKELSEQIGTHGVMAWSEGDNQGSQRQPLAWLGSSSSGTTSSIHEIKRSLIAASEMQSDLRSDEIIIVPASGPPIRCGRALYFRRPEMVQQVEANRFVSAES